jgi:hypothetical protein
LQELARRKAELLDAIANDAVASVARSCDSVLRRGSR